MRKLLLISLLWSFATTAHAQRLVIDIDGVEKPTPVGVVPFGWEGNPSERPMDLAEVISADLYRSGRFDPLEEEKMLEKPTDGSRVDFQNWRIHGVEALVVGRVSQSERDPNSYTIRFQLFDVVRGRQMLGWTMNSPKTGMRGAAHRIADMVYEKLTGIKGVFSTRVAYVTTDERSDGRWYSLWVADQDNENAFRIMESRDPIMSPAWSPDSRQLAYVSFENNKSSIVLQNLRTGSRRVVASEPGINGAPSFSPDGKKLVITLGGEEGNLDIYTLDLRNRMKWRLTNHRAIDTEGSWSPDGKYIYFTSDRSGGPQVYRIDAEGGSPERITFEGSYNARPRLSPDGKKLAVLHNDRGNFRIGVMDLETKGLLILSRGSQDESPSFAPNSDTLIYATRVRGDGVLETVSADGQVRQKLESRQGDIREPVWSPFPRY